MSSGIPGLTSAALICKVPKSIPSTAALVVEAKRRIKARHNMSCGHAALHRLSDSVIAKRFRVCLLRAITRFRYCFIVAAWRSVVVLALQSGHQRLLEHPYMLGQRGHCRSASKFSKLSLFRNMFHHSIAATWSIQLANPTIFHSVALTRISKLHIWYAVLCRDLQLYAYLGLLHFAFDHYNHYSKAQEVVSKRVMQKRLKRVLTVAHGCPCSILVGVRPLKN